MENIQLFFAAALTALAIENAIFSRALGIERDTVFMKSPAMGILYGATLTWMVFLSSFVVAFFNYVLQGNPYIRIIRPLAYLAGLVGIYIGTRYLVDRYLPDWAPVIKGAMPISAFNSVVFGAFYISASQAFNFFQTTGYALGAGFGYTIAILIVYFARKRLAISPIPRSFRGLPILLVYLGLISLAIYGLIGHNLPT